MNIHALVEQMIDDGLALAEGVPVSAKYLDAHEVRDRTPNNLDIAIEIIALEYGIPKCVLVGPLSRHSPNTPGRNVAIVIAFLCLAPRPTWKAVGRAFGVEATEAYCRYKDGARLLHNSPEVADMAIGVADVVLKALRARGGIQ